MPYDRSLIAPISGGLQRDKDPFLIPSNAYAEMFNAYVYRDRVTKRFGGDLLEADNQLPTPEKRHLQSRLRIQVGTTNSSGQLSGTAPGSVHKIGQAFSVGETIFTVYQSGNMRATNGGAGTYNTGTGAYNVTTAPANTAVYFYPAEPVMGLCLYEQDDINREDIVAFDTQFAYTYGANGWQRAGTTTWTGDNADFFLGANWRGADADSNRLFVTNNVTNDGIKYWDGATWNTLNPQFNAAGNTIETAKLIFPFKDRLVFLNVTENDGSNRTFRNRCRFSQNGSPLQADAFREDIVGKGGYIDAPTSQAIVGGTFLKDRLIVYFERSTWELVYTGNQVLPFVWQQLNSELGAESRLSVIPFDDAVLGVGSTGVHACSGTGVQRIDQKIPELIFELHNEDEGLNRVAGIREYVTEMAYWTYPDSNDRDFFDQAPWPTRVLGYNYTNGTWSVNRDSITAWGYFYPSYQAEGSAPNQVQNKQVLAGNQEGYTFQVSPFTPRNAPALQITNIQSDNAANSNLTITIVDHNLGFFDSFLLVENITEGPTGLNNTILEIDNIIDKDTVEAQVDFQVPDTYVGGGTATLVSRIDIRTKDYNFYLDKARRAYLQKVDFLVGKVISFTSGITVDFFTNTNRDSLINAANTTGSALGSYTLDTYPYINIYPHEADQELLWHPVYFQADGSFFQLRLYYTDEQMKDPDISLEDFNLHAMMFYTMPTSQRLG